MKAKTTGVFGLTNDADIIEWIRQYAYADAVAIFGDSDEWCGGLTLTNRNKMGVNVKHYVARTEVEVLEKVVERVSHLSSEVSEQLRIFQRHIVDCVSPPDVEWMKRYLQWTDVLRIGGELHGNAPTEAKVKTEEETGAKLDTSHQVAANRDTQVATLQGHINQVASDVFALNEQAERLRQEIDALSPPPQAKGVPGGTQPAEGRLPSVFQMTPQTGRGVYPGVSSPDPATVSVGGGVGTGDVGASGAPDIFSFLGVRESSGTRRRPKCDPEEPLIAYTLEEILTSVPRTFVEMRDKVVAMIFAHFFKTIQYSISALVLEYERIACQPCKFGTYTELLAYHKRFLNHLVKENIVHELGIHEVQARAPDGTPAKRPHNEVVGEADPGGPHERSGDHEGAPRHRYPGGDL
uniref:Uncharacterized protein n=1 Tax=Chromera velia CCMP2878 TaxID=1169474 RepID=A0A0G4IE48_9ALVE|eukprot:Cvel_13483.t1-p1 / transcript=Cvel_13483.t1 / gene=Cvel_13483 / organism=Chromera_velia_CCMP2878 / gene_product=hypothetical protein / transcript_product=hypothetical protein / location=Cvel_scaffold923:4006-5741(+) / protein_length=407 / sequence_SO=supercontig / SO=protein_coding / is_pseudo=false